MGLYLAAVCCMFMGFTCAAGGEASHYNYTYELQGNDGTLTHDLADWQRAPPCVLFAARTRCCRPLTLPSFLPCASPSPSLCSSPPPSAADDHYHTATGNLSTGYGFATFCYIVAAILAGSMSIFICVPTCGKSLLCSALLRVRVRAPIVC